MLSRRFLFVIVIVLVVAITAVLSLTPSPTQINIEMEWDSEMLGIEDQLPNGWLDVDLQTGRNAGKTFNGDTRSLFKTLPELQGQLIDIFGQEVVREHHLYTIAEGGIMLGDLRSNRYEGVIYTELYGKGTFSLACTNSETIHCTGTAMFR